MTTAHLNTDHFGNVAFTIKARTESLLASSHDDFPDPPLYF